MLHPRHAEGALALLAAAVALAAANQTIPPEDAWGTEPYLEILTTPETNSPRETESGGDFETADYGIRPDYDYLFDPSCPEVDPDLSDNCASVCGAYDPCPEGQLCCRNNCGGTGCVDLESQRLYTTVYPQIETTIDMDILQSTLDNNLENLTELETPRKKQRRNRCPVQDPEAPSYCGYMCGNGFGCPEGQVCCRNDCGGTDCRDPVDDEPSTTDAPEMVPITDMSIQFTTYPYYYDEELSTEMNWYPRCPSMNPDVAKPCTYVCSPDNHCPKGQVCCRNKCGGTRCIVIDEPPTTTDKQDETTYNEWSQMTEPTMTASSDNQIKFVDHENDSSNMQELKETILRCPKPDPNINAICAFMCGSCPKGKLCCPNNCGGTECVDPVKDDLPVRNEKEQFFWDLYAKNVIHQYQKAQHK